MKKFLKSILIVFALILAGLALFIATFNINRYKPMIIDATEKTLGVAVDIRHLSLSFRNGLAVEASGLSIFSDKSKSSPARLKLEKASVSLELLPLLKKDIRVTSILLMNPYIEIIREKDSSLNIGGIRFSGNESKPQPAATKASSPQVFVPLEIRRVEIQNGAVIFSDNAGASPINIEINKINVVVKDFSFLNTFSFEARAALFSEAENLRVQGKFRMPKDGKPAFLHSLVFSTDLKQMDTLKLEKALPAFASAGIETNSLAGELDASLEHLELELAGIGGAELKLSLKNASVALKSFKEPVQNLNVAASLEAGNLKLEQVSANFAGGSIRADAVIQNLMTQPVLDMRASLQDLSLDRLVQASAPRAPKLSGRLSLDIEGRSNGITGPEISKTLSGKGVVRLKDGVLLNYNLLREVIQKISIIPGAEMILQNNFPEAYKASLSENSTLLKPIEWSATIQDGVFIFDTLIVETALIAIGGAGRAGLDGDIHMSAGLSVTAQLSAALVNILNPLQILLNEQGQLFMPLTIEGKLPEVRIIPDKQYLISKLLGGQAGDILKNLMEPKDGKNKMGDFLSQITGKKNE